jgi:hypothetical protein
VTNKDRYDFTALHQEMMLGIRTQSSGRDQNAMIGYLRSLPGNILDYDFIIDEETVVRIEDPVPVSLADDSWCIIPRNHGSVVCRSRDGTQEAPGELVRGISFEEAQGMGAFLYADAGRCVELVYPREYPLPEQPRRSRGVTSTGRTTIRHAGSMVDPNSEG